MNKFLWMSLIFALIFIGCDNTKPQTSNENETEKTGANKQSNDLEGTRGKSKRNFHFTYTATIEKPEAGAKKQQLWIPIPQSNYYQEISNLKVTSPQIKTFKFNMEKTLNNKMAYAEIENPATAVTVNVEFDCIRYEHSRNTSPKKPEAKPSNKKFLQPSRLVLLDDETKDTAKKLSEGKKSGKEILQAFYNEVFKTVKYGKPADKKGSGIGDGWGDGSTQWAKQQCIGNCTDFHAYYLSLCRSVGIPARFEIGAYLKGDKSEGKVGYHCWALSWDAKEGWFPVDISEGWKGPNLKSKPELEQYYFGNHCVNRVQFTIGRDVDLEPKQKGLALNYFIYPYSEVDGKPIKTNASFHFKDN